MLVNLIYTCMTVLHDGAAIYMFAGKNCIMRGNVARDITDPGSYGASAYYLDEQSEGCVVENNLSLRVNWPFHNHMAKKNTIRNNVSIIEGDAKITFPRSSDYTLEGNVIFATGKIRIEGANAVTTWKSNLFFSQSGQIAHVNLTDYSPDTDKEGAPGDTQTGDPLFVDWAKGNFSYQPHSPALALGLKPVNINTVGRR
jgi:hypothetical protein